MRVGLAGKELRFLPELLTIEVPVADAQGVSTTRGLNGAEACIRCLPKRERGNAVLSEIAECERRCEVDSGLTEDRDGHTGRVAPRLGRLGMSR